MFDFKKPVISILLMHLCIVAYGKALQSFDFQPASYDILSEIDYGRFAAADSLLQLWPKQHDLQAPVLAAEYDFLMAHYISSSTGAKGSFERFTSAAARYDSLSLHRHRRLMEVYLIVDMYIKTRWEDTRIKGDALLATIPAEEKETRAILMNILAAAFTIEDQPKADAYSRQSLDYFLKHNNHRRAISVYGILAAGQNSLNNSEAAIVYIDSARYFAQLLDNKQQLAFLNIRKYRALFNQKKYTEAFDLLKKAEDYFIAHPSEQGQLEWIYGNAARDYALLGQYKKAFEYTRKNHELSPKLRAKENDERINALMVEYETEKKERQLEIQALSIASSQQKFNTLLILATGILIILTLSFLLFYNRYKNKRQEELRKKEFQFQKNLLDTTIETQESERKRISQDLHDGIGQQLSGLKFSLEQYVNKGPSEIQVSKFISILKDATTEVRNISHNMMPRSLQNLGLTAALYDMLEKSFEGSSVIVNFETIGDDKKLKESSALGVYRITQELINNIIKHSNATEIDLEISINSKRLLLMLEENGNGFIIDQNKISGHGLSNIQTRAQVIDGKINFEKKKTGGMLTTLTMPINA